MKTMFNTMKGKIISLGAIAVALALVLGPVSSASAAFAPNLGAASTFAVLSGSTAPGETGVATQAQIAVLNAFTALGTQACDQTLTGTITNTTLNPGVICVSSTSTFSGLLTLNGAGNSSSVFVFHVLGNTTLNGTSTIALTNGANGSNVYIRADGNVTIPANAVIEGTIIANGSVTIDPTARVNGHVFSVNGTVTANSGTVSCAGCVSNHPTLTINKTVVNDNGGTLTGNGFALLIGDMDTLTGRVNIVAPGTYTVGEIATAGYNVVAIGGACASNGAVSLALGENKTCTVLNDDTGVGLPNTGAGGGFADLFFSIVRILAIGGAAVGLTFAGVQAVRSSRHA